MENVSQLLVAIQSGDRRGFETLVRLQGKRLHAIAYKVTGDAALAEDVVQEAFLRILTLRSPFRETGTGEGWLARMVVRLGVDAMRRRDARRRREEKHVVEFDPNLGPIDDDLIKAEESETLSAGFRSLPVESRAAIWLHVVEGEGIRNVAASLGTARSTVDRRIQGGLKNLRRFLKERGFAVYPALSMGNLLRFLPVPPPSSAFLERALSLPAAHPVVPVGTHPAELAAEDAPVDPSESARKDTVGPRSGHPAFLPTAILSILGGLGTWLWLANPFGWFGPAREPVKVTVVANPRPAPVAAPVRAPEKVSDPPASAFMVRGRVVDQDGTAMEGAHVEAYDDLAARDTHALLDRWGFIELMDEVAGGFPSLAEATSDALGDFRLEFAGPGNFLLRAVSAAASPDSSGTVRLRVEEGGIDVEVVLEPGATLEGLVLDGEGRPIVGATVAILPRPTFPSERDFTSHDFSLLLEAFEPIRTMTGADGRFHVSALVFRQKVAFQALVAREGFAAFLIELKPGGPGFNGPLEVTLDSAVLVQGLTVFSPGGAPAVGARILCLGPQEDGGHWFAACSSTEDGSFSFPGGFGGSFRFLAKLPGQSTIEVRELVLDESGAPLKVEFPIGRSIRGTVRLAASGEPVAGVPVLLRDVGGAFLNAEATTDGNGAYTLQGIPIVFTYDVLVASPGFTQKEPLREPEQGEAEIVYDIDLIPTATVRGLVVGPRGEPLPGVMVEVVSTADSDREGRRLRWRREAISEKDLLTDEEGWFLDDEVIPSPNVYVFAYRVDLGESFAGPVAFSSGMKLVGEIQVQLHGAGLEILVTSADEGFLEGMEFIAVNNLLELWMPDGMQNIQWFSRRTSMDLSRYQRQTLLTPGHRECIQQDGRPCRWMDLMASQYTIYMGRTTRPDPRIWAEEHWSYWGRLQDPLVPARVSTIHVSLDLHRTLRGRVVDPDGKGLPNLRMQAYFRQQPPPGFSNMGGYSVTHSGDDGLFELICVGPGPYRVTAGDINDLISEVRNIPEGSEVRIVWPPQDAKEPPEKR